MDISIAYCGRAEKRDCEYRYYTNLEEMAAEVDVLFVTCPGGPATRGLVSAAVLDRLGPRGTIINVSRGSVIDETALVNALVDGKLGGAGLDVFQNEPDVPEKLFSLQNVVLTPHIGSGTVETRAAMAQQMVDNLTAHFSGGSLSNRLA
jgi:lactate dehydrogenase-like 2-hydroxyacid dehydrogenase